jgi:hypothetical protein
MDMRKRMILFVLSFLLFVSALFGEPIWGNLTPEETIRVAKQQKNITTERLWYESIAYEALGDIPDAYGTLDLYLAMSGERDKRWNEANLKMIAFSFANADYQRTLQVFGRISGIDAEHARYGYQAALALGDTEKAREIFDTYLKGTVDQLEYVSMLHGGNASVQSVISESTGMESDEKLAVLSLYDGQDLSAQDASLLLSFGQKLEGTVKDSALLYHMLADIATKAGQRVLARRYQILSGGNGT